MQMEAREVELQGEILHTTPALKALHSLSFFKLTQVNLWDDAPVDPCDDCPASSDSIESDDISSNSGPTISEFHLEGILQQVPSEIYRYWCQRYLLFSKYDDGIKLDKEGLFSVTPELIAKHHAMRCTDGVIVDCFTGVGGNAIQFALRGKNVIAIDIDPKKIDYARHNAKIYGVDDRIDFVTGDTFHLAPKLKANTVFLSPPWGGPDYAKLGTYDISLLQPRPGHFLFNMAKKIAPKIVMFLPKNVNIEQLAELCLSASPPWSLEVEKNFLNGKLKTITAYLSDPSV